LIVSGEFNENLHLSSRNLPYVQALDVSSVDPVSLIAHEKVIMTVDAVKKFEEMLG
jgi:large subunit ribosomal protein L4